MVGWPYAALIVPAILAVLALRTDRLPFKVGVPGTCSLILLFGVSHILGTHWGVLFVVAAFVFSMVGDYFLSNKEGDERFFVFGIGAYFLAHVGYLAFAWRNGRVSWLALALLMVGYLLYYALKLRPVVEDTVLSGAVLLYLLISCLTLAVAFGMHLPGWTKWLYVAGIALIVLSDTFISFNEFLGYQAFTPWILPTYYLAHLSITLSLLIG